MERNRNGLILIGGALVMIVIIIIAAGAISMLRSEDVEPTIPPAEQTSLDAVPGCMFDAATDSLVVYHAPLSEPSQELRTLDLPTLYPVVMQTDTHILIALDDGTRGWVDRRSGELSGTCDAVPVDDTPLTRYPTLCVLTNAEPITFYSDPELENEGGTLTPSAYIVTRRSATGYYALIEDGSGVWVRQQDVAIGGACDSLPG